MTFRLTALTTVAALLLLVATATSSTAPVALTARATAGVTWVSH